MKLLPTFCFLCATPITAIAQPYSESMMECAALSQNLAQRIDDDGEAFFMMTATNQWAKAALVQAEKEGRDLDDTALWVLIDAKTAVWKEKGWVFFLSQEFRDWASYCRKFAKHVGVDMNPSG